jgi:hypothetical protein
MILGKSPSSEFKLQIMKKKWILNTLPYETGDQAAVDLLKAYKNMKCKNCKKYFMEILRHETQVQII